MFQHLLVCFPNSILSQRQKNYSFSQERSFLLMSHKFSPNSIPPPCGLLMNWMQPTSLFSVFILFSSFFFQSFPYLFFQVNLYFLLTFLLTRSTYSIALFMHILLMYGSNYLNNMCNFFCTCINLTVQRL